MVVIDPDKKPASLQVDADGALIVSGAVGGGGGGGGDASAANQVTEIAKLTSIDDKTPALGQALAAASVPVVLPAAQITTLTPPAAITGFATSAKQDTIITGLSSIDGHVDGLEASASNIDTNAGATSDAVVAAGAAGSMSAKLRRLTTDLSALLGKFAALGKAAVSGSTPTNSKSGGDEYETVAASQTDQVLGATGAAGDYLEGLLCVVATAATSQVQIKDGSGSAITVLPNAVGPGVGSYYVPLGLTSTNGAWKVTTAAGVSVIGMGDFT
jgi:hypothetical protein